jgi:hypothetical protein
MILSACSTSLDVVGDYKETLVVYGLLDVSQDTQYVKINKAFLGAGDAYQYALIKDSTQFVNALDVTIKCVNTGITYNLTPANYIPKDPGLFYSPTQTNVIYKLVTDGSVGHPKLSATSMYELSATNGETGTRVTSKTSIVEDITGFIPPYPPAGSFTFASSSALAVVKFRVDWVSAKNARQYQLSLRLNYVDSTVSGGNVSRSLDYLTPIITTDNLAGGKTLSVEFKGKDYYKYIASSIPAYSGLINRKVSNVQVFLVAGSDDFATFIDVNKPSTGIIQERPEFTNIVGGLGLFSSRCDRTPLTRSIGNISLDSLACGQFTKTLKFVNSVGSVTATGDPICL